MMSHFMKKFIIGKKLKQRFSSGIAKIVHAMSHVAYTFLLNMSYCFVTEKEIFSILFVFHVNNILKTVYYLVFLVL